MTSQLCSSQREWAKGPLLSASWGTEQAKPGMGGIWDCNQSLYHLYPLSPHPALALCPLMGGGAGRVPQFQPHIPGPSLPRDSTGSPPPTPPGVFLAPTWPAQRPFKALWLPSRDPMGLQPEDWELDGGRHVQRVRSSSLKPQPGVGEAFLAQK